MPPLRLAVVGGAAALVAVLGWLVLPTRQEAVIGKTELNGSVKTPTPDALAAAADSAGAPPVPSVKAFPLEPGQTFRLMGVEPAPSSARFCDAAHWTGLGPVAERVEGDDIFVDAARWAERTAKERSSLASWMSKCLRAGREVAIHSSASGELLAHYDAEHGYRAGNP